MITTGGILLDFVPKMADSVPRLSRTVTRKKNSKKRYENYRQLSTTQPESCATSPGDNSYQLEFFPCL